jgi:hypothetical protein
MTNASGAPGSKSVGSIQTRLLSDSEPRQVSWELCRFESRRIEYTRGTPYHPNTPGTSGMTQGKIERCHRWMRNLVHLQNFVYHGIGVSCPRSPYQFLC